MNLFILNTSRVAWFFQTYLIVYMCVSLCARERACCGSNLFKAPA